MAAADVPGVAVATVKDGALELISFGSASPDAKIPVTADTVFEAASLSKTVFASMYLDTVASQRLSLDGPLAKTHAASRVTDTNLYKALTPRLILSHQSGLPNWAGNARIPDRTDPLEFKREPGPAYGYSGEGYELLRAHVEAQLGTSLEAWFDGYREGFGMRSSHFTYDKVPAASAVARGDSEESTRGISPSPYGIAAASLTTTARDYGAFARYLLANPALLKSLTEAQVMVEESDLGKLQFGLGWGLYERPDGRRVAFHWGDNWHFKAFVAIDLDNEIGVVYFANGVGGLKLVSTIVEPVVGDLTMVRDWLGYEED
jgi:CubicO group peptidase (beta-lactamase class C family)